MVEVRQNEGGGFESSPPYQRQIKEYDFKHPDKFSKDQLRTLQLMFESFSRLIAASLSGSLRTVVQARVTSVSQLIYDETISSIHPPAIMAIFNMEPLEGEAFFDFDPKLAFLIIERLLGGKGGVYEVSRELTDIEYSVIESIINKFLLSFKEVWAPIIDLRPKFTFIESNPQFTQIVPPTDIVVLIQIEVTIGDTKGKIGVCIPYVVIEPVVSELSSQQRYSAGKKARAKEEIERVRQCMDLVNTEVVVELGRTEITMRDVLHLKVGDVVKLDNKASEDLIVKVGGVEKFYCRPGTSGSKMAVQINGQIKQFEKAS